MDGCLLPTPLPLGGWLMDDEMKNVKRREKGT